MIAIEKETSLTNPAFLRPDKAAKHISVSRSTLYSALGTGELKSYRVRGARLIRIEDLYSFATRIPA